MEERESTEPRRVQPGNLVVDQKFSVGGDKSKLPEMRFHAQVVFEDAAEMGKCAAKYVIWLAQQKVRKSYTETQTVPYPQGRIFTINAKAEHELTPEEKQQRTIDAVLNMDPSQVTDAQRRQLMERFGLSLG